MLSCSVLSTCAMYVSGAIAMGGAVCENYALTATSTIALVTLAVLAFAALARAGDDDEELATEAPSGASHATQMISKCCQSLLGRSGTSLGGTFEKHKVVV